MEVDGNCSRAPWRPRLQSQPVHQRLLSWHGTEGRRRRRQRIISTALRATNMALIPKEFRPQITSEIIDPEPGRLVIDTREHFLYLTRADGTAIRYAVGVGREGFQWFGSAKVMRKGVWPTWTPPTEMVKRNPDISPATMKGGALNPMGPRALYLYRDGRDLLYRIHGTLEPWTIGSDVSSGCIRLLPEDLIDLYDRVPTGTDVLVMKYLV